MDRFQVACVIIIFLIGLYLGYRKGYGDSEYLIQEFSKKFGNDWENSEIEAVEEESPFWHEQYPDEDEPWATDPDAWKKGKT